MDYLPAIQFAAALNIGYVIPDIMAKMNSVLNNINNGYVAILQSVRNKIIVKAQEVNGKCVVETKDNRTTKGYIERQLDRLKMIKEFALILIPFCKHNDIWILRMFLYTFNSISCVYISVLFVMVTATKKDISCRGVFGLFMLFVLIAAGVAYVNRLLPVIIEIGPTTEKLMSSLSIAVAFIPLVGCMLFLMVLVFHATLVAKIYAIKAWMQFHRIDKSMKKLNVIDEVLGEDITTVA